MRVLSGLQTSGTGELHIGNYLGAVRQWIQLQDQNEVYYMLANLHAITVPMDPKAVKENVYKMTAMVLALGVDPEKSTLFVQSMVPEHAELTWILNTMAYMGELRRMTQFKDKAGQDQDAVSAGLFDYPVLMAADILLYQANMVPVGQDQKQHLELARNLAERFNNRFGEIFTVPEPHIPKDAARIMSLTDPTKKMSKSLGPDSYIGLLDKPNTIQDKLRKAVTDSENLVRFDVENKPGLSNLLIILSLITHQSLEGLTTHYKDQGYGQFKDDLAAALEKFLTPVQERYERLMKDRDSLEKTLRDGSKKAQTLASEILSKVKEKMGIL